MAVTTIVYVLIYLIGIAFTLSGRKIVGVYLYFFTLYFHAPSQWWGQGLPDIRWSLIAAVITALALFAKPPDGGLVFWRYTPNRLLCGLFVLVVAQLAWIQRPDIQMEYVILLGKFLLLIFLIQNIVKSRDDVRSVIIVNVIGSAWLAYYGISQSPTGRLESFGDGWDSNLAGMHFAAMLALGGYLLLERFRLSHIPLLLGMAMVMMGLFRTESRGALIALAASGVLAIIFRPTGPKRKFVTFILMGVLGASALLGPQIVERFEGMKRNETGEMEDKSAQSRFEIIESQIRMWKDAPLFGHGHRGTLLLSPRYVDDIYLTKEGVRASHNVTTAFLVDHGLVGTLLYFGAILICFRLIFQRRAAEANDSEDSYFFSTMLTGAIIALFCFMLGGQGANNKKLEADIWLIALIPVLHRQLLKTKESNAHAFEPDSLPHQTLANRLAPIAKPRHTLATLRGC